MASGSYRKFADKHSDEFLNSVNLCNEFSQQIKNKSEKIVIGGFSQGAMLTSHLAGLIAPDAMLLFSGTLFDKENLMQSLDSMNSIPFFQSHGKQDMVLEYSQAMDLFELLKLYKLKGEMISFNGGHEIPMEVISKAKEFLSNL